MVAALLAGGVLDAPGAVGLGLVDLPLLGRAGVNGGGAHRCSGRRCAACGGRFGSLVVGAGRIELGVAGAALPSVTVTVASAILAKLRSVRVTVQVPGIMPHR